MDINKKLEELKKIQEVEAPPFLLTRIKQKIKNGEVESAPLQWKWTFAVAAVAIVALNFSILFNTKEEDNNSGIETIIQSMQLSSTNELYHE